MRLKFGFSLNLKVKWKWELNVIKCITYYQS